MNLLQPVRILYQDEESTITLCFSTSTEQWVCVKRSRLYTRVSQLFERIVAIHRTINSSPFVVRYVGSFTDDSLTPHIVLEYICNDCLPNLYEATQLPARRAGCQRSDCQSRRTSRTKILRMIANQICHALEYIHAHNVWHRNISLGNILFDCLNSRGVLIDFDDAIRKDQDDHSDDVIVGNLLYAAPDISNLTSDVFAFGLCLASLYCAFGDSVFDIGR
jgi:serine/threonine protein kinase